MIGQMTPEYVWSLYTLSSSPPTDLRFKFETVHQETDPIELKVTGIIPAYAA